MSVKTRGEYEDAFTKAIIKFEKMTLGRGPKDARTYFINDMILIRLRGMLTSAETLLAEEREGRELIKETRRQLLEISRPILEQIVQDILDRKLIGLHTDMSIKTGERVIVLIIDKDLDQLFD
ncbi:MAG TPA: DUF2294 domain-containing protein [Anaerolineae bacterium]|nr:DUF2294 domain-containing protein [Anaerolineae bacterium]